MFKQPRWHHARCVFVRWGLWLDFASAMQTHIVLRQAHAKTYQYASSSFCNWNTSKHSHKIGIISSVRQFLLRSRCQYSCACVFLLSSLHLFIHSHCIQKYDPERICGLPFSSMSCHCCVPQAWRAATWSNSFYVGPHLAREYAYLPGVESLESNCAAVSFSYAGSRLGCIYNWWPNLFVKCFHFCLHLQQHKQLVLCLNTLRDRMLSKVHVVFVIGGELSINVGCVVKAVGLNCLHVSSHSIPQLVILRVL